MPKPIELRKVIQILNRYGIEFDRKTGGKHSGKFCRGSVSFPVKAHGLKTEILPYALNGLIKKFELPKDIFDKE
ncbi:MAG: hypothetical protein C4527_07275 [Candidatus Omnitrophota bacterium]|jgi:hypothetical protein|nr:MAG: hypothetical protein C4527_07275 [Candidatus Omnitrophota bacterium]